MKLDTLFISGPQGSGKGTQARLLAQRRGYYHWEMGALLRAEARLETPHGREIARLVNSGQLLGDELLIDFFTHKFAEIPESQVIMFDGFPRRLGQAEFALEFLRENDRHDLVTMLIDIPKEESIKRLLHRSTTEHRKDDTPEAIEKRLFLYQQETLPMLDLLRDKTYFIDIDGSPSIEVVATNIDAVLTEING